MQKKIYTPFIRVNDSVTKVMLDVIIALSPVILMSYLAYGIKPILVISVAIISAIVSEFLFSAIFFKKYNTIKDLSAVVTGIIMSFTLGPFTPLTTVAFGSIMATIFGKLVFGGLGKNTFNPALVGREFMTVFFTAIMTSGTILYNENYVNIREINLFNFKNENITQLLNKMLFNPSGAIGEYSVLFLILGGLYLLLKNRISWHIPVAMITVVLIGASILNSSGLEINISYGGIFLGAIFIATDMPTSPNYWFTKIYYGVMLGIAIVLFWIYGIKYEFLSYSILTLNAFARPISIIFRPNAFGQKIDWKKYILRRLIITVIIILTIIVVAQLHYLGLIKYLVYIYILYRTYKLIKSKEIK